MKSKPRTKLPTIKQVRDACRPIKDRAGYFYCACYSSNGEEVSASAGPIGCEIFAERVKDLIWSSQEERGLKGPPQ